jgi:succinyl-diaminopimelate desuccinylase
MLDLVRQAERFIATPSESRLGNAQIARAACELLGSLGIPARIESARVHGVTHHAVIADLGPREAGEGLLLLTHLDTVPPGAPDDWTATGGDPFRPTRDGDRLYGLGSADAKVDLICKAAALEGLDPGRLRRPLRIVGTFAEEIGLLGARWLVDAGGTAGMLRALVGEPSDLTAIYAHKGYAKFEALVHCPPVARAASAVSREATLRGRSAHSSTPHLGENAIEAALERLVQSDPVGLIELTAGSAVNKVPDSCHVRWLAAGASAPAAGADALDPKPVLAFFDAWRRWRGSLESWRDDLFDPPHVICNLGCAERVPDGLLFQFDLRPRGRAALSAHEPGPAGATRRDAGRGDRRRPEGLRTGAARRHEGDLHGGRASVHGRPGGGRVRRGHLGGQRASPQ